MHFVCYSLSHVFGSTTIVFVEQDQTKTYTMFPSSDLFNQELLQPLNLLNFEFVNRTSEHIVLSSSLFLENQLIYSNLMSRPIICSPFIIFKSLPKSNIHGKQLLKILGIQHKDFFHYFFYFWGARVSKYFLCGLPL